MTTQVEGQTVQYIPVDKLDIWPDLSVDQLNREYRLRGPKAVAVAKQAIAKLNELYPNATITWHSAAAVGAEGENGVPLEKLLGAPPKEIVLSVDITSVGRAKQHDKICGCLALRLIPVVGHAKRGRGQIEELTFDSERVCVDPKGARKLGEVADGREAARSAKAEAAGKPKRRTPVGPTKAQREKQMRERVAHILDAKGSYAFKAPSAETTKKLFAGGYNADKAARVVLLGFAADRLSASAEYLEIVRRVLAMKPKEVRQRVLDYAAAKIGYRLLEHHKGGGGEPFGFQQARFEFLSAYGVKASAPKPKTRTKKKGAQR